MAQTFLLFTFAALIYLCSAVDKVIQINSTDEPHYFDAQAGNYSWQFTFPKDSRGFMIFDERFRFNTGEKLIVFRNDGSLSKYFLGNFSSDTVTPLPKNLQRLTAEKGESLTIFFVSPSTVVPSSTTTTTTTTTTPGPPDAPTTTVLTTIGPTTAPKIFMFLVSSFNETASTMNNTDDSGTFTCPNINKTQEERIETFSNVTQIWHYIPANENIRLSFSLIDSSALMEGVPATLTLYRGDAEDVENSSTIIKIFDNAADVTDKFTYAVDYGQTLSLLFDYPYNSTTDVKVGFHFLVSVLILNSTDLVTVAPPVTDSSGHTIIQTNPTTQANSTGTGTTQTGTTQTTTTTSATAPIFFSLAPVIISLILQKLCQTSSN